MELLNEDCGVVGEPVDHLLREVNELIAILVTIEAAVR